MTNYFFRIIANEVELDTFQDEGVAVSNNSTGLFDIDKLPSDFTRTLKIPGSRKNNAFFEHNYDIDIDAPYLFQESEKVECYIEISGYLLVQGYLQLNNIVVENNKVSSYDISLFGTLSNFSRDLQTNFLTDVTGLDVYNHTASYDNIEDSWEGNLFSGDIVYPLVDYGKGFFYQSAATTGQYGIDTAPGTLNVKDFKPAIRVKKVVDKIFEEYGYTYTSSFFNQDMWDNIYMLCDNSKQYPIFDGVDLETYGLIKITPTSGSTSDLLLSAGTYSQLEFDTIEEDPSSAMSSGAIYTQPQNSKLRGNVKLNITISGSNTGNLPYPEFYLQMYDTNDLSSQNIELEEINKFIRQTYSQLDKTGEKTYTLEETWYFAKQESAPYEFRLKYDNIGSTPTYAVTIAKDGNTESYIEVTDVQESADFRIMEIPQNMPFGQAGITCLDFIKGLQKKYNLVITPSKQNVNQFEIETFNDWYKSGETKDLTQFIKMDKSLKVTPANNLAVNELEFTDTLGKDYLARQFNDVNLRKYGASIFIDTQNQFSQGKLSVSPVFSSSPLRYITGTGGTGTGGASSYAHAITYNASVATICNQGRFSGTAFKSTSTPLAIGDVLFWDSSLSVPLRYYPFVKDNSNGNLWYVDVYTGEILSFSLNC